MNCSADELGYDDQEWPLLSGIPIFCDPEKLDWTELDKIAWRHQPVIFVPARIHDRDFTSGLRLRPPLWSNSPPAE